VFCLLSAAFLTAPLIERLARWCDRLVDPGGRGLAPWLRRLAAVFVTTGMIAIVYAAPPWRAVRQSSRCDYNLPAVRQAMTFLKGNSAPGDVVFTDDWDIFPVYFYYNSHNHYIVGLDPKFTQFRRPVLWERYVKVSRGIVPADATVKVRDESGQQRTEKIRVTLEDIRDHFGASFVVTDRDHKRFAAKLADRSDLAELIYPSSSYAESKDAPYLVFRIRGVE
jgi:hypothetical protein